MDTGRCVCSPVMGTAPGDWQQPALTDPDQIVTQLISMLRSAGYPEREALGIIARGAGYFLGQSIRAGRDDFTLCEAVLDVALARLVAPHPSSTDREENSHADGHSRSRSRDQENPA